MHLKDNSSDPNDEIAAASEKLQRQKEIEIKWRKVMKQAFERKVNDLQQQIDKLEKENEEKDSELKEVMTRIQIVQKKLANKNGNLKNDSMTGLDETQ